MYGFIVAAFDFVKSHLIKKSFLILYPCEDFFFLHISSLKLEIHVGSAASFLSFAIDGPGLQYELIQPQTCTWEPPRGLNPGNLQG